MSGAEFLRSAWDWRPSVIAGCCALLLGYAGAARFRFSARSVFWAGGVLAIFLSLASPLETLADRYLFSVHMAKHILFVLIVPALLLMGLPAAPRSSNSGQNASRAGRFALRRALRIPPAITWGAGVGAMVVWHIPAIFNQAMASEPLHMLEHLSLLICGTLYWWPILSPLPEARMKPVPQAAAYLFTACLACTSIGIAVTFAPGLLYPAYAQPEDIYGISTLIRNGWGISPHMDQQIGGILMWAPACLVYLTGIMAMFARWYSEEANAALEAP